MRRLFWVALGATAGVLVVRRLGRLAESSSPGGVAATLSAGLSDLGTALREVAHEVREAMAQREGELRYALGIDTGTGDGSAPGSAGVSGPDAAYPMSPDEARALLDDPTGLRRG